MLNINFFVGIHPDSLLNFSVSQGVENENRLPEIAAASGNPEFTKIVTF